MDIDNNNLRNMSGDVTTKTSKLNFFKDLWPFLKPYSGRVVVTFVVLTIAAAAMLALPMAIRGIIDLGLTEENVASINLYFLLLLVLVGVLAIFASMRFYLVIWLSERIVADLRTAVFQQVIMMSPRFFEVTRIGEVLSRMTSDTTLLQSVIGVGFSIALRSFFMLTGSLLMLVNTSPELTGLILLLVIFAIIPIVYFGKKVRRLSKDTQDRVADLSALAEEVLNAIQMIQAFTLETLHCQRFIDSVEVSFQTARKRILARALLSAFAIIIVFSAIMLVLWVGTQAVIADTMTAGELSQFLLYAIILASSAAGLSEIWGDLQRASGALERIMELLASQSDIFTPENPLPFNNTVCKAVHFDKVCFNYPSSPEIKALRDISLYIDSGETIALVGPSGAGKSTVMQLLLRFYDPQQGRILIDGVNINQANLTEVRQKMAIVPQDTVIFSDNALENIRYGRPGASDEEVINAAKQAVADDFIRNFPQAYQTFLGERGMRLSGGQKQRIAIARAILKNPQILLLDEATSALDAESEKQVQEALNFLMQGRTTIVIAHRLATVLKADRILVMQQGEIIASGSHAELMAQGGLYARLATFQFGTENNKFLS